MKMNVRGIKPKLPQTACEKLMRIHFLPDLVSANRDLKSSYYLSLPPCSFKANHIDALPGLLLSKYPLGDPKWPQT